MASIDKDGALRLGAVLAAAATLLAVGVFFYRQSGLPTPITRLAPQPAESAAPAVPVKPRPTAKKSESASAAAAARATMSTPNAADTTSTAATAATPESGAVPVAGHTERADIPLSVTLPPVIVVASPRTPDPIYTEADAEVTPPEVVRPFAPPRFSNDTRDLLHIELVVDATGNVETAAIVPDASRSLGDAMLSTFALHTIRSWKYRPAMKDGQTVKYRQQLWFKGTGEKTSKP